MKQIKFFEIAKRLSEKSDYHHKLGAVVVKKGRIIGIGFNKSNKTHPKSKTPYQTIHAEFDAIIGILHKDLKGAEIYIYRELKNGQLAMAKPCAHCRNLIEQAGIKIINYTSNEGFEQEIIKVC